ncbi:sigma 54-interacting transcriptional regulator [Colwellia echini]|uniref:sigma 54-interacting transcriptional regulator n=1 Tax=Colwellia echini TaxID=1982103 RepID=UPI001FEB7DA1|nr:sigma 54-interacting transcriptional regulator [Colwellia echini]
MRLQITCHQPIVVAQNILGLSLGQQINITFIEFIQEDKIVVTVISGKDIEQAHDEDHIIATLKLIDDVLTIEKLSDLSDETRTRHKIQQQNTTPFSAIQADSSEMRKVIREAKRMSSLDASILIMGETGTGKELLARACHAASERSDNPFMTLSCAALPDDVAESELFGVGEKDQAESKRGIFELADGGTVFLDEIGEMSAKLQSKLLRVIQYGSFRRVDSEQEVNVNVRIISSTNKDLVNLVSIGEFREDLYYRLNVFGLSIPALRERQVDILPLTELFVAQAAQKIGRNNFKISDECRDFIEHYPWPGNIRQLENVITSTVSLLEGNVIEIMHLPLPLYSREHGYLEQDFEGTLETALKNFEADILRKLYPAYPSSRQLAKKLGLSHTAVANKLREYDISKSTIKN